MQMNMSQWKDMLRVLVLGRPLNMGSEHLVPELHPAQTVGASAATGLSFCS